MTTLKNYLPLKSLIDKKVDSIRLHIVDDDFDIVFKDGTAISFYSKNGIMFGIESGEDYNKEMSYKI